MKPSHIQPVAPYFAAAVAPADYAVMDAEALCTLCQLRAEGWISVLLSDEPAADRTLLERALAEIGEEVARRALCGSSDEDRIYLAQALHALKRAGYRCPNLLQQVDRQLVEQVLAHRPANWRLRHAALSLLMQEPLSSVQFVGMGRRKRLFSMGEEWFEQTLCRWTRTIGPEGAWPDVEPEEALSRVLLFEQDFGSIEAVDNRDLMERAYRYYAPRMDRSSARALEIGYHACVWQWEREASVEEIQPFIADARALLDSDGLREADRWRLCALLLQAADYWNGLTAESVA